MLNREALCFKRTGAAINTDLFFCWKETINCSQFFPGIQSASVITIKSPFAFCMPASIAFFLDYCSVVVTGCMR